MNEKTSGLFQVIVRFTNMRGEPLAGRDWKVAVMDEDPMDDDELGKATLNDEGEARLLLSMSDVLSIDSPGERKPDLYFVLYHYDREVYRSSVWRDVDFEALDPVTGEADQLTRDFGTLKVNIGN